MKSSIDFHKNILQIDPKREIDRIVAQLRNDIFRVLKKRGGVLGVSGGVDSAVVLALAVQALGSDKLIALLLPEKESSPDSARLARQVCQQFGVKPIVEEITGPLIGFGCYTRRDEAVRELFPEYNSTYKLKITLPSHMEDNEQLNIFRLTIISPEGETQTKRLNPFQLSQIVAATNFKQRSRAAMLYYHAELRNFAVIGTPQKNEHEQGFFVKFGDGAMDVKPIGHLFKSQVYQLSDYLDIPTEIRNNPPTADTYSAGSTQEEFFFRLPFKELDLIWYAMEQNIPPKDIAPVLEISIDQVERVIRDIRQKKRSTNHLRTEPLGLKESILCGLL